MKNEFSGSRLFIGVGLLISAGMVQAQSASIEERIRAQLRIVSQQLQTLQSQQADLQAARQGAEAERDAARKEAAALREKLAESNRQRSSQHGGREAASLVQAQQELEGVRAQLLKEQSAHRTLDKQVSNLLGKSAELQLSTGESEAAVRSCVARNQEMYAAGRELLTAYEAFGTGDLLTIRQPFAGRARVLFEEKAQALGDKLYHSQVEVNTLPSMVNGAVQTSTTTQNADGTQK